MASVRTGSILAALPEPATAQQSSEDRPAVCAVGLAKSHGSTVALTGLDLRVAPGKTVAPLGQNLAMQLPMYRPSTSAVWADALFASMLQLSDGPCAGQVRKAVTAAMGAYGGHPVPAGTRPGSTDPRAAPNGPTPTARSDLIGGPR